MGSVCVNDESVSCSNVISSPGSKSCLPNKRKNVSKLHNQAVKWKSHDSTIIGKVALTDSGLIETTLRQMNTSYSLGYFKTQIFFRASYSQLFSSLCLLVDNCIKVITSSPTKLIYLIVLAQQVAEPKGILTNVWVGRDHRSTIQFFSKSSL